MKKNLSTAKIGRCRRPSPVWLDEEFFSSNYFQNWASMQSSHLLIIWLVTCNYLSFVSSCCLKFANSRSHKILYFLPQCFKKRSNQLCILKLSLDITLFGRKYLRFGHSEVSLSLRKWKLKFLTVSIEFESTELEIGRTHHISERPTVTAKHVN